MIRRPLHRGFVMIRHPLHRGCHDQVSSTQRIVMIRCPLHRGLS
jgi:hypothetical protein